MSTRQQALPAYFMRGGTSKGVFLLLSDLPESARDAGLQRDAFLLRLLGSPDPYGTQVDGMGGATPSTSKVILVSPASRPGHDLEYLFGAVAVDRAVVDWSANCGNLTSAVASFAIERGLIAVPDGIAAVRLWQANVGQTIVAHLACQGGLPVETGTFDFDGVAFPSAEVGLEFLEDPDAGRGPMFPTGQRIDTLEAPGIGSVKATCIASGAPTVFVRAVDFGLTGTETKVALAQNARALQALVHVRAEAAVRMGLCTTLESAVDTPHAPRIAFVGPAGSYTTSSGGAVDAAGIDLVVRILSLGQMHAAMTGTGAVALATAAAVPGTVVSQVLADGPRGHIVFGHPAGTLACGADVQELADGRLVASTVRMSRSCRVLMRGEVMYPPL